MAGLTPAYSPYDSGGGQRIFSVNPMLQPDRRVGEEPPDLPPIGLLGLLALGLGYWGTHQSPSPDGPAANAGPTSPAAQGGREDDLASLRRVSDRTDKINGGPGRTSYNGLATINRAAQLTGLADGGLTLGQRTRFPSVTTGDNLTNLPAVLRGIDFGPTADIPRQASTNERTGWQDFATPPSLFDDLAIPDFLRRTQDKDNGTAQPEKRSPAIPRFVGRGSGGDGGGGGGDGGNGGDDDDCIEERKNARKICVDAYADGWNGNHTAWRSDFRVGPYKKKSGGRWTIQDCMKGLIRKDCGGEDPNDPENQEKYAWRPGTRRRGRR